jgi:hypothetical protein
MYPMESFIVDLHLLMENHFRIILLHTPYYTPHSTQIPSDLRQSSRNTEKLFGPSLPHLSGFSVSANQDVSDNQHSINVAASSPHT